MIPRVFHRIWLGSDLPDEFARYGETWQTHHPGWELRLWTDDCLPRLRYPDLYDRCRNYRQKSNMCRYEILLEHGGVYIDTDFECLRNIETLIGKTQAFAAYQLEDPGGLGAVNNALIGVVPGHPLMRDVVESLPEHFDEFHQLNIGPRFFTKIVRRHPEVKLFPKEMFYPYKWTEVKRKGQDFSGTAYAVHHWQSVKRKSPRPS